MRIPCTVEPGAKLPKYASIGSAGADLCAHVPAPVSLAPGERRLIPTGLRVQIPQGYEGQVRPRSGLAVRSGITVLNSPGTIDSDYRGEVSVVLINHGSEPFVVNNGERIAQLVVSPVVRAELEMSVALDSSARGEQGFGSTGV